jgi:hypothetical protein
MRKNSTALIFATVHMSQVVVIVAAAAAADDNSGSGVIVLIIIVAVIFIVLSHCHCCYSPIQFSFGEKLITKYRCYQC